MNKHTFRCDLSPESIRKAANDLRQYRQGLPSKAEELRRQIAERIAADARGGFATALVDDLLQGGSRNADVEVKTDDTGTASIVIAIGKDPKGTDAIWCEFGAGVYHNGPVGSSPHPKGAELGFTIGTYGEGKGARQVWGFYDDGELKLTHGTPASMPMYNAMQRVCDEIARIAQEVFA